MVSKGNHVVQCGQKCDIQTYKSCAQYQKKTVNSNWTSVIRYIFWRGINAYFLHPLPTYRGRNPNDHVFASTVCSAYNEHTWWCNMSYERKFCQLSEYVRVQKVGSLIKSAHVFKWNSADFDKFVNSQKSVNFRQFS